MPTQVTIRGPRNGRGCVLVEQVDPKQMRTGVPATSSPAVILPGEERDFYVDSGRGKAFLVSEHERAPAGVAEQAKRVIDVTASTSAAQGKRK